MPKKTFYNLPAEKRKKIINAAIEEFSKRPFQSARVTAIIKKSEIANGSFYQYFDSKKDLYKYILDYSVEKKLNYINQDLTTNYQNYNLFEVLREMFLSGFRFAQENPKLKDIALKLGQDKELYHEIFGEYKDSTVEFYKKLLEKASKNETLDPSLDIQFTAKMLTNFNYTLGNFIYKGEKIDLEESMKIIDKMIYIIKNGIAKNRKEI